MRQTRPVDDGSTSSAVGRAAARPDHAAFATSLSACDLGPVRGPGLLLGAASRPAGGPDVAESWTGRTTSLRAARRARRRDRCAGAGAAGWCRSAASATADAVADRACRCSCWPGRSSPRSWRCCRCRSSRRRRRSSRSIDDGARLIDCIVATPRAPRGGYAIGASLGFVIGVGDRLVAARSATGCHPILRFIGPLPATAWLPLAFFVFPVERERQHLPDRAGHRLPGDGAHLVGRRRRQQRLLRRRPHARRQPALPGAQGRDPGGDAARLRRPVHGARRSFAVLVVAEMMGVKSGPRLVPAMGPGLGAPTPTCTPRCSSWRWCAPALITLLFRVRDRLLSWQKGLVRW